MLNNSISSKKIIGGKEIVLKTGGIARQANGSVILQCGDTILLATATMSKEPREDIDFFPLMVEYSEKMYSSGKIPGGFFKREARPSTTATLTARLIDRPLRPCFPKNLKNDVQIIITVLSYDMSLPVEALAIISASAAVAVSDIPFNDPVGAALVAEYNGELIVNPSTEILENSTLNIVVSGTKEAILMVEASASEVSEEKICEAIMFAHTFIKESIELQESLVSTAGKEKQLAPEALSFPEIEAKIHDIIKDRIETNLNSGSKKDLENFLAKLEKEVICSFIDEKTDKVVNAKNIYHKIKKDKIRKAIIHNKIRPDNRKFNEIRPISIDIAPLPSTHGSAIFTRGETQSLGVVTLGTANDEQIEDGLQGSFKKPYFFHYNFPPFSVGETGFLRTGRRELGHGALAERALKAILPDTADFPYTIRIVSEILESNGSSSMASVCSGSLSLMDCGVPVKAPVSGIAMGLLIEGGSYAILSDIQGLEDHYGDMDFKVAGTENGITALQLDIKIAGLSHEILMEALEQAKEGRLFILSKMTEVLDKPRSTVSENAPKIEYIYIEPEKVGLVIGPGGKNIRMIEEVSGSTVTITDGNSGQVCIYAKNKESLDKAKQQIFQMTREPKTGDIVVGKINKLMAFGAFVEVMPGKDGLLHISTLSKDRSAKIEDLLKEGDSIKVQIKDIDKQKKISLLPVD
ncbi:MAG: polyribonucleotide nucleotidyltransferase [bacterium]|nr:polyribonucleotide nucleotidyltransferase [bacterium]